MGISGATRRDELTKMSIDDIKGEHSVLIVAILDSKSRFCKFYRQNYKARMLHISLNWSMTRRKVVKELSTLKRVDLSMEKKLAVLNSGILCCTTSIKT
jgi:hypothetical protein